jgi:hypothetical protein
MFFKPVEISLIQQNKIISGDNSVLKGKVKVLETKADTFNSEIVRLLSITEKKTN